MASRFYGSLPSQTESRPRTLPGPVPYFPGETKDTHTLGKAEMGHTIPKEWGDGRMRESDSGKDSLNLGVPILHKRGWHGRRHDGKVGA
jgi:hypothetical protein